MISDVMTTKLLKGKEVSESILVTLKKEIESLKGTTGSIPGFSGNSGWKQSRFTNLCRSEEIGLRKYRHKIF